MKKQTITALKAGAAPLVLGLALISVPSFAQDAADDAEGEPEIVVTGTLIRSPNLVSSAPISAIGADEIQLRQTNSAEEVLRQIPGAIPSIGSNVNNGNGGASYVNLRGLGSNRNIVLLDGARIVPSGVTGRVDLNNIPVALVQRVDALTGGASTTYGADAVSGVVNFVTKRDFAGVEVNVGTKITEQGDGFGYNANVTIGANFDDGRGNAVLSIGYENADPIYQGDRDVSVFGISSASGRASGSSFTSVPTTISFASGDFQVDPTGTSLIAQYQGYNFNPYNIFVTPIKRFNMYSAARYEISDAVEVYTRAMFSRNTVSTIIAPSGIFGEPLTIPANNPYLPASIRDQICTLNGIPLGATCDNDPALALPAVYRRSVELGPRISEYKTDIFDFQAGVRGDITDTIQYDVYGAYGESDNTETKKGYVSTTRVRNALNATNTTTCLGSDTLCVPLDLFGPLGSITPAQAAYIGGITSKITNSAKLGQVHAQMSSELMTLGTASKPITVAVGGEYRNYSAKVDPDNLALVPGELGGAGGATLPVDGGFTVKELFGELNLPIMSDRPFFEDLTVDAGIRQSWYTVNAPGDPKFSATTWKAGLSWSPVDALKLRGNYARAVRAPNISELFSPVSTGLTNLLVDPCAGAQTPAQVTPTNPLNANLANPNFANICLAQGAPSVGLIQNPSAGQANAYGGGNPNLRPETAKSYTFGAVITPSDLIPNLSLTVDYYNIKIADAITSPTPDDVLGACFGNVTAASATSVACTSIRRSTANGRLSGSSATVPGLPTPLSNLGKLATDGIDFTMNYRRDIGFAKLALSLAGNWTNHSKFQATPTSVNRECVGFYSANCASIQPKWQWYQRTTLTFGAVDVSLAWRHLSSVKYEPGLPALFSGTITNAPGANSPLAGQTFNFNRISAYDYFDLATRAEVGDHLELTFAVTNLFNKKPPLVGGQAGSTSYNSGNTYPSTYDAVGRRFAVAAKLKF